MHNNISLTYSETYMNCTERLSTTQYGGDLVTLCNVPYVTIKNKNFNYPPK